MKKIPSLFIRDFGGSRNLVTDKLNPEVSWVADGYGEATVKIDGTACMIRGGKLFKRYDRKRNRKTGEYKPAPDGWEGCSLPDPITGHWPGWLPVGDGPEDKWLREARDSVSGVSFFEAGDGTYEAVGEKIQGNPYSLRVHLLIHHGTPYRSQPYPHPSATYEKVKAWCEEHPECEGLVWHHPDGRMAKVKRKDFGLPWPVKDVEE